MYFFSLQNKLIKPFLVKLNFKAYILIINKPLTTTFNLIAS